MTNEYQREYAKKHRGLINTYQKKYKQTHKEKIKELARGCRKRKREKWMLYFKEHGLDKCSKCGYDQCFAAIDFHHTDPSTKERGINRVLFLSITPERIKEIEQCIPLCKNCHTEFHHGCK